MTELGSGLDFQQEAFDADRGGELGMEHLERHGAVVAEVAGEVHRGHAAVSELALNGIAAPERIGEEGRDVGQGDARSRCVMWDRPSQLADCPQLTTRVAERQGPAPGTRHLA